jgi:hypothetical protein
LLPDSIAVELKDQPFAPPLAHKLGDVPHVSGLLRRIAQLSGAGERVAEWLLKVAIARGGKHYQRDFDPRLRRRRRECTSTRAVGHVAETTNHFGPGKTSTDW